MGGLFTALTSAGYLILLGLVISAFVAYWLGKKIQSSVYRHTGRVFLSFLYGLPSFLALFFFFSLIAWSIGIAIMESATGRGSVEVFIMTGGFVVLPLVALIFLTSTVLLVGNASSLKNNPVQKVSGIKLFLYTVPVLIPTLVAAFSIFALSL